MTNAVHSLFFWSRREWIGAFCRALGKRLPLLVVKATLATHESSSARMRQMRRRCDGQAPAPCPSNAVGVPAGRRTAIARKESRLC